MEEKAVVVKNVSKNFKIDQRKGISKLSNLKKNHQSSKTIKALENISFEVQKGEILGILGLNGSGKSTLLRIIAGVYHPDNGYVRISGRMSQLMQLGVGFQGYLNAKENIIMNGMLMGLSKSAIEKNVDEIMKFAELEKFTNLRLEHFSTGMRSRLAFATAMKVDPDILLIDEILSVGDRTFRTKSYDAFLSYKKNKKTILHATHQLDKVAELSDKVILLHQGKQVMIGEPQEVIKKYKEIKSINQSL